MRNRLWLTLAIACEVIATVCLKGALTFPWLYAVVIIGEVASFYCLDRVLRGGMDMGISYAIWGAAGVAATALLSAVFYGEAMGLRMIAGLALIVTGVVLIELGSAKVE